MGDEGRGTLSPRDLARALGASESSLKRWVDGGLIVAQRTPGGHRRITVAEALRFVRERHATLVHPEMLGLRARAGARTTLGLSNLGTALRDALVADDAPTAHALLAEAWLGGESLAALGDVPIREAFDAIGELWLNGPDGIVREHRAVRICLDGLRLLAERMPEPAADSVVTAVGGAPSGDPYLLGTLLTWLTLRENGLRAVDLGSDVPDAALLTAVDLYHPKVLWLSLSSDDAARALAQRLEPLLMALRERDVPLVIGGRCRWTAAEAASTRPAVVYLESLRDLAAFARARMVACAAGN